MTNVESSNSSIESVSVIVRKIKLLAERLKLAVIQQDNLTKGCFGKTVNKENAEKMKKKYALRQNEYQALTEQVKTGESRLHEILEEYKTYGNENICLKETKNRIINRKDVSFEDEKIAEMLTEKLRTLKLLTGIRFDFNTLENTLAGYVGISDKTSSKSTLVPFEVDRKKSNINVILWEKINQACSEVSLTNENTN